MLLFAIARAFNDIPSGWATVSAAIIDVGGPVLLAVVGALMGWVLRRLKRIQADTQKTVAHVANEHTDDEGNPINLRDDIDGKQDETRSLLTEALDKLAQIQKVQVDQARDIGGIRHELRTLHENDGEQVRQANRDREQAQKDRERLDQLERTIPRDKLGRFSPRDSDA